MLSRLLPTYQSTQTIVCSSIIEIREKLQNQKFASTPMIFSTDMRAIVSYFHNRDQSRNCRQDDVTSFVEEILLHFIDHSVEDFERNFQTKILSFSNCRTWGKTGSSAREHVVLPLNLFENSIPNLSVQSLILKSTVTDDRFHDFDCDCPSEDESFTQRMFYLQLAVARLIIIFGQQPKPATKQFQTLSFR